MKSPAKELLRLAQSRRSEMHSLLERLVKCESPSFDKPAVDRCARLLAAEWRRRGARVAVQRQKQRGDHLLVDTRLGPVRATGQTLLLGHLDTVYERGALKRMPWRVSGGRAFGPGVFDMKAGLVIALFAVDLLRATRTVLRTHVRCLWTSDEEIGSQTSRTFIEREARRSAAVLVLEPAAGLDGKVKTARKGVGEAELIVTGRAAHAGLNPQDGVNAVHELALQIERLMRLNDYRRGTTVNVDIIEGGSRTNVIAEHARAVVDLRAARVTDARILERKLYALRPILPGARIEVRGGMTRHPLERKMALALYGKARAIAAEMGMVLGEASVGGGSDGNLTAALGVPTLDGLGAVGEGAHSPGENILVQELPRRAALLAGLIASL